MKNSIKLLSIAFLFGAFFASCEGPEGPAGEDGVDGVNGIDGEPGTATCFTCHNDAQKVAIEAQFASSQHYAGDIAVAYAGARSSCAECHSHEGFVEWASTGEVAANISAPSAWECATCHDLHVNMDSTDWALRANDAVTLAGGSTFDSGNNNLCANCHQARRTDADFDDSGLIDETFTGDDYADMAAAANAGEIAWGPTGGIKDDNGTDTITITYDVASGYKYINSTHAGPHHGPQANMLVGVGAAGGVTGDTYGPHSGGCVTCHMDGTDHSFEPKSATCEACHNDGTDKQSDMDAVYDRLVLIANALEAIHAVHIDATWESGDPLFGAVHPMLASLPTDEFQAWWNFMYMMEDRSLSAHNPTLFEDMLTECETTLGL